MTTCYILDDEQHTIDTLQGYIERTPELVNLGSSLDPTAGWSELQRLEDIDLIFLDIDMPGLSGLEVASLLSPKIAVVFITAYANYALDAFELNAVDFLLKPISYGRFLKAIQKIQGTSRRSLGTETRNDTLFINPGTRGKIVQISLEEIMYIEGMKNYVIIYTSGNGKHITYLTMSEIEVALPKSDFVRIHKSYIVNKIKIKSIEGNRIYLNDRLELALGIRYKDSFMKIISSLTLKSKRKDSSGKT